ncbi:DNA polymerase II [Gilvimarinus sp. F26214L]|uniref:DNA polymerase II n=1 Tax=Gilvimarinus sp. DZF01 TaxID=3461371 RepID=UPI0040468689
MNAFLLTRHWRDTPSGIGLELWCASEHGPVAIAIDGQEGVFFVRESDLEQATSTLAPSIPRVGQARLRNLGNEPVVPLYFAGHRHLREAASALSSAGIPHWEADIRPPERFLMERFITAGLAVEGAVESAGKLHRAPNPRLSASEYRPDLKVVSLDIETSMDAKRLYSIAVYGHDVRQVFMVDGESEDSPGLTIVRCENARTCLRVFLRWLDGYDPDVLIGWNVVQFDLWVLAGLCQRHKVPFTLGRAGQRVQWREDEDGHRRYIQVPGRVVLDGIELMKAATYNFPSFALESVAQAVLGEGKLLHSADRGLEITELFRTDKRRLAEYNLQDCILVWKIVEECKLLQFAIERAHLTGLPLDRSGGSVAAFEYAYLPLLHRKGYVAPNLGELQSDLLSPGGYVLDSQPGIYKNVLVLDFKSLYPSIIRTFRVDPYGFWFARHNRLSEAELVPGFRGASFAKNEHLLPGIIERLWAARDRAKAENNQPLSQAIKIIMNSFYGVLGSTGCRFYDPRVCSSITLRGHEIIQTSKRWIEEQGFTVIYGDTDSLFLWVGNDLDEEQARAVGVGLAATLNNRWTAKLHEDFGIDSALELEFETHYLQFLMPTIRGSEQGSKKRYAGVVRQRGEERLVFKGLENVRTDWTQLAKTFQEEIYRRVFAGEAVEDFVKETVQAVRAGQRDGQLVYRKRLRRKLADYTKNVPPHVQAARKLLAQRQVSTGRGDWIEYLITTNGPEPVKALQSPIDYNHYVDRQLAPVADGILRFVGLSFEDIIEPQMNLFGL